MPIPDFIVELRRHVGRAELWLPAVTAVVIRGNDVLLVKRSDTGEWSPVTGIVDPGEDPGVAARREVLEEAGVDVSVDRLAWVHALPTSTHVNGDVATYLDHTFACSYLGGEAHVGDDESLEVGWRPLDDLPPMRQSLRRPDQVRARRRPGHPLHLLTYPRRMADTDAPFGGFPVAALDFYDDLEMDNTKSFWDRPQGGLRRRVKAPMHRARRGARAGVRQGQGVPALPRRPVRQGQDAVQDPPGRVRRRRPVDRLVRPGVGAAGVRVGVGFYEASSSRLASIRARSPTTAPAGAAKIIAKLEQVWVARRRDAQDLAARVRRGPPAHRPAAPQVADARSGPTASARSSTPPSCSTSCPSGLARRPAVRGLDQRERRRRLGASFRACGGLAITRSISQWARHGGDQSVVVDVVDRRPPRCLPPCRPSSTDGLIVADVGAAVLPLANESLMVNSEGLDRLAMASVPEARDALVPVVAGALGVEHRRADRVLDDGVLGEQRQPVAP